MTPEQVTQLGIAAIFGLACIRLFNILQERNMEFVKFLIEQNAEIRKQNIALAEQNKLLSLALFSNNPDAMRAYGAMQKTTSVYSSIPTPTDLGETK